VLSEVGKRGGTFEETEKSIKEKVGMSMEDLMKSAQEKEGDLRKRLATIAEEQLKLSQIIAPSVVLIKEAVLTFVGRTLGAPETAAKFLEPGGDALRKLILWLRALDLGDKPPVGKRK
jgi:hypothetical protein